MKPPRLAACYFGDARFQRMAAVLDFSARRHCEGWTIDVVKIEAKLPNSPLGIQSHATNTVKLDWWADQIAQAEDGDRILLIDGDTMVLRDLTPMWERDFDLAYTTKQATKYPFNGGVVAVRATPAARAFIAEWRSENKRLLNDSPQHQIWRKKFGGVNQASFGMMLETGRPQALGLNLAEIPCLEWNCEDSCWPKFSPAVTRVVHLKSQLRREIFLREARTPCCVPLAKIWRALDAEASRWATRPELLSALAHPLRAPTPPRVPYFVTAVRRKAGG